MAVRSRWRLSANVTRTTRAAKYGKAPAHEVFRACRDCPHGSAFTEAFARLSELGCRPQPRPDTDNNAEQRRRNPSHLRTLARRGRRRRPRRPDGLVRGRCDPRNAVDPRDAAGEDRGNPEGQSRDPAVLRSRLWQAPQRARALVSHRHVLLQWPAIDLGISARHTAGRSDRPRRSHGKSGNDARTALDFVSLHPGYSTGADANSGSSRRSGPTENTLPI
jgi:hypothetical protein